MSHTPGPWRTYENSGRQVIATTEAWAYAATGFLPVDDKQTEIDNARLIAKAPEMLEALKDVVNTFGWVDGEVRTETAKRVIAVIRAAEGK